MPLPLPSERGLIAIDERLAAAHAPLPVSVQASLAASSDKVATRLAARDDLTTPIAARLLEHPGPQVRQAALRNPACPQEALVAACASTRLALDELEILARRRNDADAVRGLLRRNAYASQLLGPALANAALPDDFVAELVARAATRSELMLTAGLFRALRRPAVLAGATAALRTRWRDTYRTAALEMRIGEPSSVPAGIIDAVATSLVEELRERAARKEALPWSLERLLMLGMSVFSPAQAAAVGAALQGVPLPGRQSGSLLADTYRSAMARDDEAAAMASAGAATDAESLVAMARSASLGDRSAHSLLLNPALPSSAALEIVERWYATRLGEAARLRRFDGPFLLALSERYAKLLDDEDLARQLAPVILKEVAWRATDARPARHDEHAILRHERLLAYLDEPAREQLAWPLAHTFLGSNAELDATVLRLLGPYLGGPLRPLFNEVALGFVGSLADLRRLFDTLVTPGPTSASPAPELTEVG